MTREQAESKIIELLRQIVEVAHEYAPESEYLSLSLCKGQLSVNNDYWEDSTNNKIQHWEDYESD